MRSSRLPRAQRLRKSPDPQNPDYPPQTNVRENSAIPAHWFATTSAAGARASTIVNSAEAAKADSLSRLQEAVTPTALALFGIKGTPAQVEVSNPWSAPKALVVRTQVRYPQLWGGTQTAYLPVVDDLGSPVTGAEITMTVRYKCGFRKLRRLSSGDCGGLILGRSGVA